MARTVRLVSIELRAQWRALVPSQLLRVVIVTLCVAWVTFFSYAAVIAVRGSTRSRADALVPLMSMFATTALAVSMSAIARTLEQPDRFAVWRLAPLAPAQAVAIPLAAAALLTAGATLTFAMPAVVAAAANHLLQALVVAVLAVIIALWILVLAITILGVVASRRGVAAAARLGRTSMGPIAVLMIAGLRVAAANAHRIDQVMATGVWLASAALLPAAMRGAAARWSAALAIGPTPRRSPSPRWGSPSWGRLLQRTPLAWAMLGVIPLVISASTTTLGVAVMFALIAPSAAMFHLVQWEDDCPDRQQLAPAGAKLRLGLWMHVGMPASILASAIGVAVLQDVQRLAVFVLAAWAGPLLFLWTRRRLRSAVQMAVLIVATIFLLTAADADAQGRRPGVIAEKTSTAVVRGTVVAAHTGTPLARARVRLVASVDRQSITVAADARGVFEFRDLQPGRYTLSATKGGFVPAQYGQRRAFVAGTPIEVRAGDELDRLDIHLAPGASVDGRVLDEFGEPVVDAVVMTLRTQFAGGRKRVAAAGRVLTTNDRGEFHLFGLPAGTYYLSAAPMSGQNAGDTSGREGYAPTYFPGTVDLASAQPLVIEEGEQRVNVDVTLNLVRTATVSGVARDGGGRAFGSGTVTVINLVSGFPMPVASGAILGDGAFRIANVPPGQFTVVASTAAGADGSRLTAAQRVAVTGDDVAGLLLIAPQPASIAGVIAREAGESEPLPPAVQLRLASADPIDDLNDPGTVLRGNADGSFSATVRSGRIRVELPGGPPGWFLSRVLQGDRDITDDGIALDPAEAIDNVRVLLTRRVTAVAGTVVDSMRRPATDYSVVLFARDRARWTFRSRYVAAVRPDQQGTFSIKGMPRGDYLIAAIDHVEQGEGQDPEFLEAIRSRSQPLMLDDGELRQLTLPLSRRP